MADAGESGGRDLPRLAVFLVTWNHWRDTRECLGSLFASDYPREQLDIWVVDNASADETVDALRVEFPQIHLIENTWNAGFAHAMNQALAAALALDAPPELCLLLNNDTLLDLAMLRALVAELGAHPESAVVAPTIYYAAKPDTIWYGGGRIDPLTCRAWHERIRTTDSVPATSAPTDYASGCALLIRASVLRQVGLLDEGYFMYWEDADLCQRVRAAGHDVRYVPQARMWHKVSTSTGGNLAPKKLWRKFVSGYRFWSRYHAGSGWVQRYLASSWRDYRKARAIA